MSRSLSRRSLRPVLYFRLVAVVLITALLSPGLYLGSFTGVKVAAANVANAPVINEPPEPFILARENESIAGSTLLAASSLFDKVHRAYGTALGFLTPKKGFLKTKQPMPVTAGGSVEFDFDNDGKADVGRWRGSEFDLDDWRINGEVGSGGL